MSASDIKFTTFVCEFPELYDINNDQIELNTITPIVKTVAKKGKEHDYISLRIMINIRCSTSVDGKYNIELICLKTKQVLKFGAFNIKDLVKQSTPKKHFTSNNIQDIYNRQWEKFAVNLNHNILVNKIEIPDKGLFVLQIVKYGDREPLDAYIFEVE